jgi:hypothetical protein
LRHASIHSPGVGATASSVAENLSTQMKLRAGGDSVMHSRSSSIDQTNRAATYYIIVQGGFSDYKSSRASVGNEGAIRINEASEHGEEGLPIKSTPNTVSNHSSLSNLGAQPN